MLASRSLDTILKSGNNNPPPLKRNEIYSIFTARNGKSITLRPLRRGDLAAMVPFANGFVRERKRNRDLGITSLERRMTRADEKAFLDKTLSGISKKRCVSVAAFDGERLVGHCDITGRVSSDERHTGLLGIVVAEGYRGAGLGEEMVKTALGQATKLGIWAIELEVFATNAPARRIYEKLGFRPYGTIPKKVLRDGKFIDIIGMYAHLPHI